MQAHSKFRKKKGLDLDQHRLFFMFRLRYTKYCSVLGLRISQIFRYDICSDTKLLIFAKSYDRFSLGLPISQIFRYDICIDTKLSIFDISFDTFSPDSF